MAEQDDGPRYTYRMTPDEYARYLDERDVLASVPRHAGNAMRNVRNAGGRWITDGTHASVSYDDGWYWVRTRRPVPWI